ncbi:hypothetical protein FP2506_07971 [Fulvimarina pelagi HTCC2506]|uniref:DUF998 domain-containing protein n=1 Tax=Fulvimarina pelagi HTCC2506 TaxID=314231 RepID=Q0G6F2_9HYPH|nr:hypothetical protein [Fulvimarina pelagi]EAU42762.1 hypothetical protein FP2506_07971 [Fulvimarina pelagi HTCC2506]
MSLTQSKSRLPTIRIMPLCWLIPIAISAACILLTLVLSARTGTPLSDFYRDANAIAGHPPYFGFLEYVTSITMLMTGAIVLFTALTETAPSRETLRFGALLGLLTLALGADDLFMIHESVKSIHPILSEKLVYACYALTLFVMIVLYYRQMLKSAFIFLLVALGFLFLGALEDQFGKLFPERLEDFWELVGFIVWGTYAVITAVDIKRGVLDA